MPVGSLVTRVTNYTTSMSDLFTNVLVNLVKKYFDGCRGFRHDAHRFLVLSFNSIRLLMRGIPYFLCLPSCYLPRL